MSESPNQVGWIPQDIDAEKSILATILMHPERTDMVVENLREDDFYSTPNRDIYRVIKALSMEGREISRMSIMAQLQQDGRYDAVGGMPYISELVDVEWVESRFEFAVQRVRDLSLQRRAAEVGRQMMLQGMSQRTNVEELLESAEKGLSEIVSEKFKPSYMDVGAIVHQVYEEVKARSTTGERLFGVRSGFELLDERLSGFHKGNLVILAARPGMGKTALALNIAANASLLYGHAVVVFSLEMSKEELAFRLISSEARINAKRLRDGNLSVGEMEKFMDAVEKFHDAKIIIDDTPALSIFELRARCRRLAREGRCDMILLDYLQLARGSGSTQSREQEIAEISRMLKAIAKELRIPVIALSQLNRSVESRNPKKPQLSDLRESGAIEQDADVIMFIYRDEYYNKESKEKGVAELDVAKQRNGPTGSVKVAFQPEYTRFDNLQFVSGEESIGFGE